jgi:hypothetical protein
VAKDVLHSGDDERGRRAEDEREPGERRTFTLPLRRPLTALRNLLPRRLRGSRAAAAGLVVVVILGSAWFLRTGASRLEAPERERPGASEPTEPPVLTSDTPFALLVQGGERVVRLDRRQDRTITSEIPGSPGGVRPNLTVGAWVTADVTVLLGPAPGGQVAVMLDRSGGAPPRRIGPGVRILPGPHGWTGWLVRASGGGRFTVQEYGLDAKPRGPAVAVPAGTEPVAVVDMSLVLSATGGVLSVWSPGPDAPEPLGAAGRVVGAARNLIVVAQDCPRSAECPHAVINTTSGDVTRLGVTGRMRPLTAPTISQDGLWMAQLVDPDGADGRAEVALAVGTVLAHGDDLSEVTGTRYPLPAGTGVERNLVPPTWSLDGRIFGYLPDEKFIYAFQPGDTIARRLDVPAPKPVSRIVAA